MNILHSAGTIIVGAYTKPCAIKRSQINLLQSTVACAHTDVCSRYSRSNIKHCTQIINVSAIAGLMYM